MRSVKFTRRAEKSANALIKRSPEIATLIGNQIERLRENPTPNNSIKLVGYPYFRCRVGSYRIVYEVDDSLLHITVIAKRDQVYREVRKMYAK
jgi:mRNA interferase RelE/StbE